MNDKLIVTAHSGCEGTKPNSKEYIMLAMSSEADFIEVDIRDNNGNLVLSHDEVLNSSYELSLGDMIFLLKGSEKKINFDLKEENLLEKVILFLEKNNVKNKYVFSGTVSVNNRQYIHKVLLNPECIDENFYAKIYDYKDFTLFMNNVKDLGFRSINIDYRYIDEEKINRCKKLGIDVFVWTIDDTVTMKKYMDMGVKGITTNFVYDLTRLTNQ